ncbi:hypothetical protein GCM10009069_29140 [Algimonas arctica]|uniref:Uncharacterized protein n=1 Tax=Algimonas arctica TaxID=1479486 RepID=A0A8J3CS97_9PROT|nr:hypothetical protein [Algimonas arctica]GHB04742.1 hypothetical protein GCM10009069_29140 [Algimonas arctica]
MKHADGSPNYLNHLQPPSDDEIWSQISDRFSDLRDYFEVMRLETRDEAVHETYPRWHDREIGFEVRSWNLIQFRKSDDHEGLERAFECGRGLIQAIHNSIKKQELSPSFFQQWGMFCECAGVVSSAYFAQGHDVVQDQQAIAGRKKSKDPQLKWYLHFKAKLSADYEHGVKEANSEILKVIAMILTGEIEPPELFSHAWFKALVSNRSFQGLSVTGSSDHELKFSSVITKNTNTKKNPRAKNLFLEKSSNGIQIPSVDLKDYY